jgi:alpha-glucosidase
MEASKDVADGRLRRPLGPEAVSGNEGWWRAGVFYENHMPSLRDGDGDGIGDIQGLIDSLDYLADTLGITAVWLSPCFPSPMLDQGFDISNYCDIEPTFGDLGLFDQLVARAHARDVRILADYVPNHTSDQHPWFVASRSSRDDPKRHWYVWADAKPDGSLPNNWTSEAGGSVWTWDPATGQYYLHSHLKEMPDLNWRSPQVRAAMFDVLRFWLDRGVDGFRIDVAHLLMKDPLLRDNPPKDVAADNPFDVQHPDFGSQFHVHDRLHPDVHEVLRDIRSTVDEYPGKVLIGEIEAMDWADWASYFGEQLDEIHLPFAFRLIETAWTAAELTREINDLYESLPVGAWPILALGNHDRSRLATRVGAEQTRVAAMLLMTLPGTPIVFYGDELGLADQPVPRGRQRDHFAFSEGGVSRDPIRTPMPWDETPNAGFSTAEEDRLWLPVSNEWERLNVKTQLADGESLLSLYRALIGAREKSPALLRGTYRDLGCASTVAAGCLLYERRAGDLRAVVALNLTGSAQPIALPEPFRVVLSTNPDRLDEMLGDAVSLGPNEGVVLIPVEPPTGTRL